MCTEKEALEKIQSLTELELTSFMESLFDHLSKNDLQDAAINAIGGVTYQSIDRDLDAARSEIDTLENERDDLLEEVEELREKIQQIKDLL